MLSTQEARQPHSYMRSLRRRPFDAAGLALLVATLALAVLVPLIAPHDPSAQDATRRLLPPGTSGHFLGTDHLGRDVFSRMLHGLRLSVIVGMGAVALGGVGGGLLGLVSATAKHRFGRLDMLIQRALDAVMAFPIVVLALGVVVAFGASVTSVVWALALAYAPLAARVTRAAALAERSRPYVEAARALGASETRVAWQHIAPACLSPWLVLVSAEVGAAMLAESALSFLGLGAQEPQASLGGMLGGAALPYLEQAPWLALWPGVALCVAVLAFNLSGDALRDALDPHTLRGFP